MPTFDIAASLSHPAVIATLSVIGLGLLILLVRELHRIPASLLVLMSIAFVDMIGVFLVVPLVPFLIARFGEHVGTTVSMEVLPEKVLLFGKPVGIGVIGGLLTSTFNAAQLMTAPYWGRFSDRFGRRPALMVALLASALAYVLFGFAHSLWLIFLARLVQGGGGGTVGVVQAYVADSTAPEDRARALGWLSAATNLGVALGPVLGFVAVWLGKVGSAPASAAEPVSALVPGLLAALICVINIGLARRYLPESNPAGAAGQPERKPIDQAAVDVPGSNPARAVAVQPQRKPIGQAVWHVVSRAAEPSSRLIWIYAIAIGAFQGTGAVLGFFLIKRFHVTETTIMVFFMYQGAISVFARVLLLGRLLDRLGEARLSRLGIVLLATGLCGFPFAESLPMLALTFGLMPLGTAFTFPCVTGLLSRIVAPQDRGLYMGVQQTFGGAARIAAPLFYGWAFDHIAIGSPWLFSAAFVLATLPLGYGLGQFSGRKPASVKT